MACNKFVKGCDAQTEADSEFKFPKIKLPKIKIPSSIKCNACKGCVLLTNPFAAMACKVACDKLVTEKSHCDEVQTQSDAFDFKSVDNTEQIIYKILFHAFEDEEVSQTEADSEFKLPKIKIPTALKCAACGSCSKIGNPFGQMACKFACDKLVKGCDATQSDNEFKIKLPKIKIPSGVKCVACKGCSLIKNQFAQMACNMACDKFAKDCETTSAAEEEMTSMEELTDEEEVIMNTVFSDVKELADEEFKIKLPKIKIPTSVKCTACKSCPLIKNPFAQMACKMACDNLVKGCGEAQSDEEFKLPKIKIPSGIKCAACNGCSLIKNPFAQMACKVACDKLVKEKNNCDSVASMSAEEVSSNTEEAIFNILFSNMEDVEELADEEFKFQIPKIKLPKIKIPSAVKCTACKGCSLIKNQFAQMACQFACDKMAADCVSTASFSG
jgi:hypothetical protein